ncbi:MAG: LysR family transcriptional regulator [Pseudomonadota bacterium]
MSRSVSYQTLRRLAYFEAIAQAGSIRGAARRMGLSVPVLSLSLAELEQELGVTLATRSTRRMELTSAGREVFGKASEMMEAAQSALSGFDTNRPLSGRVGVTLPAELVLHWLPQRLSQFRSLHPAVELSVDANDHVVDLGTSRYDMAIRTEFQQKRPATYQSSDRGTRWLDVVMVASQAPPSVTLNDKQELELNTAFMVAPGGRDWVGAYRKNASDLVLLRPSNVITVANREAAIAFAREGLGCALVTEIAVLDDLSSGRLVRVMPDMSFGGIALRAVMRDKLPSPAARAFRDLLLGSD